MNKLPTSPKTDKRTRTHDPLLDPNLPLLMKDYESIVYVFIFMITYYAQCKSPTVRGVTYETHAVAFYTAS